MLPNRRKRTGKRTAFALALVLALLASCGTVGRETGDTSVSIQIENAGKQMTRSVPQTADTGQETEEQARLEEEARQAAEQARLEEEARQAAEQARLEEEARQAAEQARLEEEARQAAEQARLEEEARQAAEQARLEEEARQAAEQARLEEEARQAAERARLEEEARQASAQKAQKKAVPSTQSTEHTIYITKTGKRYHYDPHCNGGTYYESTLEAALAKGLTPCKKCVG